MSKISFTKLALAESLRSIMRKKKFDRITVEEICESAGVGRRNFYNHFIDKYELLTWTYEHFFCQTVQLHDDWTVMDYFPQIAADLYSDMYFYRNAFTIEGQNSFRSFCISKLTPLFMHDYADVFSSESAAAFYIEHICNAFFDYYLVWFDEDDPFPPREFTSHVRSSIAKVARRTAEIFEGKPALPDKWIE
ncbi:MAG: TetR/AcrR family transcriptional regulator C-terminal domain-containing protein [Oscillospiraceae bacterium]